MSLFAAASAEAADIAGQALYESKCALCHQADGNGAAGLAPSLNGTLKRYLGSAQGTQYLAQILISGMAGKIESNGEIFVGLMPSFSDQLSDAEIAATFEYVLRAFNGVTAPSPVTAAAVSAARATAPTASATRKLRDPAQ